MSPFNFWALRTVYTVKVFIIPTLSVKMPYLSENDSDSRRRFLVWLVGFFNVATWQCEKSCNLTFALHGFLFFFFVLISDIQKSINYWFRINW